MIGAFARHKAQQRAMQSLQQRAAATAANVQAYLGQQGQGLMSPQQQQALALGSGSTAGYYSAATASHIYLTAASTGTSITTGSGTNWYTTSGTGSAEIVVRPPRVRDGEATVIDLPDGSRLDVKADGSYEVIDKDARITYRANRMRNFNPFLNASDKLEEFIRFCGQHRVDKDEMMDMPVRLFIAWLVQEAAQADQEPSPPEVNLLPDLRARRSPRCGGCGRFLRRTLVKQKIEFCAPVCFDRHYRRQLVAA